jgi:predicted secreted protein
MPDPTFIPGYLGTVTLNLEDISAIGSVVSLQKTRNVMTKPTFGNPWGFSLGGQKIAQFSANGHISAEQAAALEAAFASDLPIEFSLQVGEGSGVTDAGLHTGNCVLSSYTIEANADGEWDWSIEAQTSGTVVYTPASPGS